MKSFSLNSRTPLFWIIATLFSVSGIIFGIRYFPRAFPIVSISITMDRQAALQKADQLAKKYHWGPVGYAQTALFNVDEETKNFIELELGGPAALTRILQEKIYYPYQWRVRHYKEFDAHETDIFFTPEGTAYGFIAKIAEETAGPALEKTAARQLAEKEAATDWQIDFNSYTLVEHSVTKQPNDRADHTLTYELNTKREKDAPYRLQLQVTGDTLTALIRSLKVPDTFKRRYQSMRAMNDMIARIAYFLFMFIYLGSALCALFLLTRKRVVLWKEAFTCSGILAFLSALTTISNLPLVWINYNTALSVVQTYVSTFTSMVASFAMTFVLYGIVFAAAEALTRIAFPEQVQFWQLWRTRTAATPHVVGRTIGGYLAVGFFLAFVVFVYAFSSRYLGWWTPSSSLIDPNILSTYMPWFDAVITSFDAGFMEECLFRAIPLALAALIGQRWGARRHWLIVGCIVQAIIFGAAHANYPSYPAYARLLELIIPSLVFGALYIVYGLLPGILAHFMYDAIWFSLPVFLSYASYAWINKLLIILLCTLPLIFIAYARFKQGQWHSLNPTTRNNAWQPPAKISSADTTDHSIITHTPLPSLIVLAILLIGSIGLWYTHAPLKNDTSTIDSTRAQATHISDAIMEQLPHEQQTRAWRTISWVESVISDQYVFAWRANKQWYHQLIGTHLPSVEWHVRYAQFSGDLIKRGEEYNIFIAHNARITRHEHIVPESFKLTSIDESAARVRAYDEIKRQYNLDKTAVEEIGAVSVKHPQRIDWLFTFKDNALSTYAASSPDYAQGQARINVEISGDMVTDCYRYVFVPEQWQRTYQNEATIYRMLEQLCSFILLGLLGYYALRAIDQWIKHRLPVRILALVSGGLIIKSFTQLANLYYLFIASYRTDRALISQWISSFVATLFDFLPTALLLGLLVAFMVCSRFKYRRPGNIYHKWLTGVVAGCSAATFLICINAYITKTKPFALEISHASALLPSLSLCLYAITYYIKITVTLFCVWYTIDRIANSAQKGPILATLFAFVMGFVLFGMNPLPSLVHLAVMGVATSITLLTLYYYVLRIDRSLIPAVVAGIIFLTMTQYSIINPYPYAYIGALCATLAVAALSFYFVRLLERNNL